MIVEEGNQTITLMFFWSNPNEDLGGVGINVLHLLHLIVLLLNIILVDTKGIDPKVWEAIHWMLGEKDMEKLK